MLMAQQTGQAQQGTDALPYADGFSVTGNFVVSSVDLTNSVNPSAVDPILGIKFSTGTLVTSGVPANADILAAYLYWETIHLTGATNIEAGVEFDGKSVNTPNIDLVKSGPVVLGTGAPCYSAGNNSLTMTMLKADVLRLLPLQLDVNGVPTGKRLVNGNHTVKLPDAGGGNVVPETSGATLFVVYRDQETDRTKNPLRRVVVYDFLNNGPIYVQPNLTTTTTQKLRGFYKSSAATLSQGVAKAKIAYIGGSK